jgi:glycosyltransferase involved in cell wall biosynthesis
VVEDQIRKLLDRYPGRYEITVLCADRFAHDGGTDIYWQESVRVVRFKTSSKEWHSYRDDESKKFMQDWLRRESFDVVHVHALQVLTASVLEAVAAASIPYIVSIHDAWWFSPHQFLTSPSGQPVDPQDWLAETGMRPPSPTSGGEVVSVAAQLRKLEKLLRLLHRNAQEQSEASARGDISQRGQLQAKRRELDVRLEDLITDQSIRIRVYSAYVRQRDLLGILHGATARLAVSSSFARLCAQAGTEEVEVLNNSWQIFSPGGVRPDAAPLECAFIGGWSLHKGAGILLEACQLLGEAEQIRLRIVDHSLAADEYCAVKWGGIDVRFIAPIPMTGMQLFYSSIDVLIAPSIWPESFGLVTREALAAGVWVIAADSGALAEPVFDSINGQVIPPRDAQALADAIRWACTPEGRKVLQGWREDALAGIGSNKPPDNLETLHSLYKKAAGIS